MTHATEDIAKKGTTSNFIDLGHVGMPGIIRRPGVDPVGVFQLLVGGEAEEEIRCVSDCASEGREEELYVFRGIV